VSRGGSVSARRTASSVAALWKVKRVERWLASLAWRAGSLVCSVSLRRKRAAGALLHGAVRG
jgi:hypothetical protein